MEQRRGRWSRQDWFDVGVAVALTALTVSVLVGLSQRSGPTTTIGWWLAIGHTAAVAGRRRFPRLAFAMSALTGLAYLALGLEMVGLGLAALVMVYSIAAEVPRRQSLAALGAVEVGMVLAVVVGGTGMQTDTVIGNVLVLVVAWFIGDTNRRRRELNSIEQQRAAQRAVAEERMRIARELHDVVAHSMSAVTVQAGMARMVIEDDPELAKRSLASIEKTGQEAMDEMRRLLHVLRSDNGAPTARTPAPHLANLDALVDQAAAVGTRVEVSVSGNVRTLLPGVGLAAYRVVQESLTNIRKHAPGSHGKISIDYGEEAVTVQVDSELPVGARPGPEGHGLAGMRERVALYDGDVEAAPHPDGTFRVRARLPYSGERT